MLRGVKGLTPEQIARCKAKGAIVDEEATPSAPPSPNATITSSQQAYEKAKNAMFAEIRNGLIGLASKAATGLYELMDDPETPHATRIRAYQLALDRGLPIPASMQQEQAPSPGVPIISYEAMRYITNEELDIIEGIIARAKQRKATNPNVSRGPGITKREHPGACLDVLFYAFLTIPLARS